MIGSNVQLLGKQDNPGQGRGKSADIHAYDSGAPQQYLGVVTDGNYGWPTIYVAEVPGWIQFDGDGRVLPGYFHYESDDCTGIPYMFSEHAFRIQRVGEQYYIGEKVAPVSLTIGSMFSGYTLECENNIMIPPNQRFVLVQEILEGDLPFTVPITLPFDFRVD